MVTRFTLGLSELRLINGRKTASPQEEVVKVTENPEDYEIG